MIALAKPLRSILPPALILLATFLAYGEQLGYQLTDVDVQPLIASGRIETLDDLGCVLTGPLMQGRMPNALYWRPVMSLSFGADLAVWGLDPRGFHLTHLLLHALIGLLVYGFVVRLWRELAQPGGRLIATVASLLFVLHPIHVENVPAVARRADILATLFLILTLHALLLAFRSPSVWPKVAAQASCVLGMASKEAGFAIPVVGLIFVVCCHPARGRDGMKRKAFLTAPLLASGALVFALRAWILHDVGGADAATQGEPWWRVLHSGWLHAIGLLAPGAPELLAFPPGWKLKLLARAHPVSAVLILLGLIAVAAWTIRALKRTLSDPTPPRRLATFLAGSMAAIALVYIQVVFQPRYLYPSTIFFAILTAWGLHACLAAVNAPVSARRWFRPAVACTALALLVVTLLATSPIADRRGMDEWRTSAELAQDILDEVDEHVAGLEPGTRIYLVNFPWRFESPYVPWSVMLLEHSVQGWLELRFPKKKLEAVGLSYIVLDSPRCEQAIDVEMTADHLMHVRIPAPGWGTSFPWSTAFLPETASLYRFEGPERGESLDIHLLDEDPAPVFLVWHIDGVTLERGWSWHVSSPEATAAGR